MLSEADVYETCCEYPNQPASWDEIDRLEQELQVKLPTDYREFLWRRNGGEFATLTIKTPWHPSGGDQLRCLFGVGKGVDSEEVLGDEADLELFGNTRPVELLPIGQTLLGHLLLLAFTNGAPAQILIKKAYDAEGFEILCESFSQIFNLLEQK